MPTKPNDSTVNKVVDNLDDILALVAAGAGAGSIAAGVPVAIAAWKLISGIINRGDQLPQRTDEQVIQAVHVKARTGLNEHVLLTEKWADR